MMTLSLQMRKLQLAQEHTSLPDGTRCTSLSPMPTFLTPGTPGSLFRVKMRATALPANCSAAALAPLKLNVTKKLESRRVFSRSSQRVRSSCREQREGMIQGNRKSTLSARSFRHSCYGTATITIMGQATSLGPSGLDPSRGGALWAALRLRPRSFHSRFPPAVLSLTELLPCGWACTRCSAMPWHPVPTALWAGITFFV